MVQKDEVSDQFEYQEEGSEERLGDLLKEKEVYRFSWTKTVLVLFTVIGVIFLSLSLLFNLGKKSLITSDQLALKEENQTEVSLSTAIGSEALQKQLVDQMRQSARKPVTSKTQPSTEKSSSDLTKDPSKYTASSRNKAVKSVSYRLDAVTPVSSYSLSSNPSTTTKVQPRTSAPSVGHAFKVIAGTFKEKANAFSLIKNLKQKGIDSFMWVKKGQHSNFYKVQVAAFDNRQEAEAFRIRISRQGVQSYIFYKP
ncbi:MAG: SPOR domain-containing protein [bacterium]